MDTERDDLIREAKAELDKKEPTPTTNGPANVHIVASCDYKRLHTRLERRQYQTQPPIWRIDVDVFGSLRFGPE